MDSSAMRYYHNYCCPGSRSKLIPVIRGFQSTEFREQSTTSMLILVILVIRGAPSLRKATTSASQDTWTNPTCLIHSYTTKVGVSKIILTHPLLSIKATELLFPNP